MLVVVLRGGGEMEGGGQQQAACVPCGAVGCASNDPLTLCVWLLLPPCLGCAVLCCVRACSCMPPNDVPAVQRTVLVAGPAQLARHTVEEALESAERLAQRAGAAPHSARVQEAQQLQAARDTQMELDAHFVAVRQGRAARRGGGAPEWVPHSPLHLVGYMT